MKTSGIALYGAFLLLGITSLIAWNTWIASDAYYRRRLRDSPYADIFQGRFATYYMTTNLLSLSTFVFIGHKVTPQLRVPLGLALSTCVFVIAALLPTTLSVDAFFAITLLLIVISAVGAALMTAVFTIAAQYSATLIQSTSTGQGLAGTIPAVVSLLSLLYPRPMQGPDEEPATGSTFLTSAAISLLAAITYYFLPGPEKVAAGYRSIPNGSESTEPVHGSVIDDEATPHQSQTPSPPSLTTEQQQHRQRRRQRRSSASSTSLIATSKTTIVSTLHKIFPFVLAVWLNFVVTLGVYPAVTASIISRDPTVDRNLFIAVGFLIFNITDIIGKFSAGWEMLRLARGRSNLIAALLRLLFIPLILMCNVSLSSDSMARRILPLAFGDVAFFVILGSLAGSSGWLATSVLCAAADGFDGSVAAGDETRLAADMALFTISLGLTSGSYLSLMLSS